MGPLQRARFFFHETLGFIHAPRRTRKTRHAFLHEKPFRYPYVDTGENDFFRVDVWIFKGLFVQKCMSNFPRSPRRVDRSKRFSAIIQRYYSALLFQRYYFRLFQRYYFRLFQRYFSAIFQRYFSAIIQRYYFSAIFQRYFRSNIISLLFFSAISFRRYFISALFFSAISGKGKGQRTKDKGQRTFLVAGPILPTDYLQKLLVLNGSPPA